MQRHFDMLRGTHTFMAMVTCGRPTPAADSIIIAAKLANDRTFGVSVGVELHLPVDVLNLPDPVTDRVFTIVPGLQEALLGVPRAVGLGSFRDCPLQHLQLAPRRSVLRSFAPSAPRRRRPTSAPLAGR